jgi:putative glutamine amidotransferase
MGTLLNTRPLVGVTTSEVRRAETVSPARHADFPRKELALGLAYAQALEQAGAAPVVLPLVDLAAVPSLVSRLDGICLSGGPDLQPAQYGEGDHPALGPTEPTMDEFELEVARWADRLGLPVLGICRGAQALNVARGGSLHQHLPERRDILCHRQTVAGHIATPPVHLRPSSVLGRSVGRAELAVNSFHHQAIARLGRDMQAVGWAPDGIVEAVEAADRPFLVGVQWHAECLTDRSEQAAIFQAFVSAARSQGASEPAAEVA